MTADVADLFLDRAMEVASEMFPDQPDGFPFGDFDIATVKLPKGEDFDIPSDDETSDDEVINEETGFGSVIVVDNTPVVPQEKVEKLTNVMKRLFGGVGTIREGGFHMPIDPETKCSKGFAFIEFETPGEAQAAQRLGHKYKLDKNHVFLVSMFDDFEKYEKVPEQYTAPNLPDYEDQGNLQQWMIDKYGRDQFVIRYMDETEIYWNDSKRGQPELVYQRSNWTESIVQWSPYGSYLATLHRQGVAVWGGIAFKQLQKYAHPDVRRIDISPNERYLVTSSTVKDKEGMLEILVFIFDVRSGQKLRVFKGYPEDFMRFEDTASGTLKWPIFKWAGGKEDKFFAKIGTSRTGQAVISVYECPEMGLLDKKSLKLDAVEDFEWSPSEPIMCIYHRESQEGNIPAKINLMKLPGRTEIRQKNLFNVSSVEIFWHPQGDFLAVKVDRHTKTKKTIYTSFELFCIRERDIPMEVLELPNKTEKVLTFAWEPQGHRFVIVHGDGPRYNVSFYSMKDEKGKLSVKPVGSLKDKHCNAVYWSPKGKNIILAGLKTMNGQLEFFNVDLFETMGQAEHFMTSDIEWDPAGLVVATSVTAIHQMENGFNMWTFQGRNLYRVPRDRFFQFSWRPRAASLLTQEQKESIKKTLPDKIRAWEREHVARAEEANREVMEKRQQMVDEWKAYLDTKREWVEREENFKKEMYGDRYEEPEFKMVEVTLSETLSVTEELYKDD